MIRQMTEKDLDVIVRIEETCFTDPWSKQGFADSLHEASAHLLVIEDGAHALGAEYKGKKIGALSDMTTFSFHPVKPITTGEGGMVLTNNEELYQRLSLFRSHGITRDSELLLKNEGPWYYE